MKRIIALLLILLLSLQFIPMAFAADTIKFRDFEWLDNYKNVKAGCDKIDGIKASWFMQTSEKTTIYAWDYDLDIFDSNKTVQEGGVRLSYSEIPVAGYKASLKLSFLYPIVNNKIQYETNSAQLVSAVYTIDDLTDVQGAFNDLTGKLSSLYGTPVDKSYTNPLFDYTDPKGLLWTANDGSLVWLTMSYNLFEEKYTSISITYAAPGMNGMIIDLINQINKEASDLEAATRESNSSNTGGL